MYKNLSSFSSYLVKNQDSNNIEIERVQCFYPNFPIKATRMIEYGGGGGFKSINKARIKYCASHFNMLQSVATIWKAYTQQLLFEECWITPFAVREMDTFKTFPYWPKYSLC